MIPINQIICGNNIDVLKSFPNECIDLVITSPPYDDLRDYNEYHINYDILIEHLYRILKNGKIVVFIIQDRINNKAKTTSSFYIMNKFQQYGFLLHDIMIFEKTNFMPQFKKKRFPNAFDFMFIFSKGDVDTFNPIMVKSLYTLQYKHSTYRQKNGLTKTRNKTNIASKEFKIIGNVWKYEVGTPSTNDKFAFQHPAIFPEDLARDHIYTWSNQGDIVIDPFSGSGTTCKMAYLMKRNYIGIDISQDYCDIAKKRLQLYINKQKPQIDWDRLLNPSLLIKHESLRKFGF